MGKLTHLKIAQAQPREGLYPLKDGNGLELRVYPTGAKVWVWRKMVNRKRQFKTLGSYPELGLAEARRIAEQLSNPEAAMIAAAAQAEHFTLKELFDRWIELKATQIKDTARIQLIFNKYMSPLYGFKFSEIKPLQVITALQVAVDFGYVETAKRICGWLAQLERYAATIGAVKTMTMQGLSRALPSKAGGQMPAIHPDQLPEYMGKIMTISPHSPYAWDLIRVGFYTLLRPGEYTSMLWDWIDLKEDIITVPAEYMKMKRAHRVPICRQLHTMLEGMRRAGPYVFPSIDDINTPICNSTLPRLFRRSCMRDILVPHGIRSIGRTWMAERGFDHAASELCLAHAVGSAVERAYNRTDLLEQRREIMQAWADYVQSCIEGARGMTDATPN